MTFSSKGYLFVELDITDLTTFNERYVPSVRPVLEQFGGRFLISDEQPVVREGGRTVRKVVLIEFASIETAKAFYDSPEYQSVMPHRLRSANAHLYVLNGVTG